MADENSSELHPSGKQLVFIFMASTVVAVVIFLCGVMVGRGVPIQRGGAIVPAVDAPPIGTSAEQLDSTLGAPVATADAADLTYYRRLGADEPLDEELEGGGPATEPERAEGGETRPARQAVPTAGTLTRPSEEEGFTVQIAALRGRADAGAIVDQLAAKGYPAYVMEPVPNAPVRVYRVRVGRYRERRQAEQILRRLEEEEQFKPWITR
jgi:hypothetical protein